MSTSICFYPLGLENKDISVDNNTNGYESIADVDEVVKEVEEDTNRDIVWMGGDKDSLSYDNNTVEDTKDRVHQHHPIQGTLGLHLDHMDQTSIGGVDQDQSYH